MTDTLTISDVKKDKSEKTLTARKPRKTVSKDSSKTVEVKVKKTPGRKPKAAETVVEALDTPAVVETPAEPKAVEKPKRVIKKAVKKVEAEAVVEQTATESTTKQTAKAVKQVEEPEVKAEQEEQKPKKEKAPHVKLGIKHLTELKELRTVDLEELASKVGFDGSNMHRKDIMFKLVENELKDTEATIDCLGVLEILQDGFGFLRAPSDNYLPGPEDIYVSPNQIRKFGLKKGDTIEGTIRPPAPNERYFALLQIDSVNFNEPDKAKYRTSFDKLIPLYPEDKFNLADNIDPKTKKQNLTGRVIDIVAPIGKGQRSLIVAPPKAGKTMMLQSIIHSIEENHPEAHVIVLLIDERPEEVTDMMRSVKGEVVSSTFDEPASRHVQVAEMVLEKAKRLVEMGQDVVILLDSITRLARAYNTVIPSSGKVLTGGVDAQALHKPKRFFGAARNIEDGGSLSIIATGLVDTGSRMDEVIFEEFKGTGNQELWLDRKLIEKRLYPAIDIAKSGTRKEELLVPKDELMKTWALRRMLLPMGTSGAMEFLIGKLKVTDNNERFFKSMNSQ
jgi:transcription termination factor Rho